jgi:putative oxidoreductase
MANLFGGKTEDFGKLLLRLTVGGLMLFHGIGKIQSGVEWMKQPLTAHHLPGFLAYGVYIAELLAPALILAGYRARLASLVVAFDMVMAVFLVQREQLLAIKGAGGGWGIELEAFFFLAAMAIFFIGSGKLKLSKSSGVWD